MVAMSVLRRSILPLLCLLIFIVFTSYALLGAQLKDKSGDILLLVFVFLALPRLYENQLVVYRNFFISLLWAYLSLILSSTLFPPTEYAYLGWVIDAFTG